MAIDDDPLQAMVHLHAAEAQQSVHYDGLRARVVGLVATISGFLVTFADRGADVTLFLVGLAVVGYLVSHRIGVTLTGHRATAASLRTAIAERVPEIAPALAPAAPEKRQIEILSYGDTWDVIAFGIPLLTALVMRL